MVRFFSKKKLNWEHFTDPDWTGSSTPQEHPTQPIDIPQPPRQDRLDVGDISPLSQGPNQSNSLAELSRSFAGLSYSSPTQGIVSGESYDGAVTRNQSNVSRYSGESRRASKASPAQYGSYESNMSYGHSWNALELLYFTEDVRCRLCTAPTDEDIAGISQFLDHLLLGEEYLQPERTQRMDLATIAESRFDKLLEDIHKARQLLPEDIVRNAVKLQELWQKRFSNKYYELDSNRLFDIQSGGDLKHVHLGSDDGHIWKVDHVDQDENVWTKILVGKWWPNIACCLRDGAVTRNEEVVNVLPNGTVVLPLLTGEENEFEGNKTTIVKEGTVRQVHIGLMTAQKTVKVLRGHKLESRHAPSDGIRYDGEYRVVQFGLAWDEETDIYKGRVILERVQEGQTSMDKIMAIPKPSQLDDWKLYQRMTFVQDELALRLSSKERESLLIYSRQSSPRRVV